MQYIPNTDAERAEMLRTIGVDSVEALLARVPAAASPRSLASCSTILPPLTSARSEAIAALRRGCPAGANSERAVAGREAQGGVAPRAAQRQLGCEA